MSSLIEKVSYYVGYYAYLPSGRPRGYLGRYLLYLRTVKKGRA